MSVLAIWMNGVYVGQWQRAGRFPAVLRYDDAWVNSVTGRPLSLSLPFTSTEAQISGDVVTHYFENLLPDNPTILFSLEMGPRGGYFVWLLFMMCSLLGLGRGKALNSCTFET